MKTANQIKEEGLKELKKFDNNVEMMKIYSSFAECMAAKEKFFEQLKKDVREAREREKSATC